MPGQSPQEGLLSSGSRIPWRRFGLGEVEGDRQERLCPRRLTDRILRLSDSQLIHRQYLASPVWKAKREEALAFYGCKCNRCGEFGNDVHHKTYERVGGMEKMEDLEILCRECHEAHHSVDKVCRSQGQDRAIHRQAIYAKLSGKHAQLILEKFPKCSNLRDCICFGDPEIARYSASLLGCNYVMGIREWRDWGPKQKPKYSWKELKEIEKSEKMFRKRRNRY